MDSKENQFSHRFMKITGTKIEKVLALRKEGLSYDKIAKQTKISRSSVIKIVKTEKKDEDRVIDAWVYKDCPNPRLILIHFGDKEKWAKCVVKAGRYNLQGKPLQVRKIETTDEELYRQV